MSMTKSDIIHNVLSDMIDEHVPCGIASSKMCELIGELYDIADSKEEEGLVEKIESKLRRSKSHAEKCEHMTCENYNFHGGWSKGYFDGKITAFQDVIDELQRED